MSPPPLFGLALPSLRPRPAAGGEALRAPRPPGRLIWLHAPGPDPAPGLEELGRRLAEEDGFALLLTGPATGLLAGAVVQPAPEENPAELRAFLDHWQPELVVFADGGLRPALLQEARARHLPLMLVEARSPRLIKGRDRWFSGQLRKSLAAFSHIAVIDESAAAEFRKAGAAAQVISVTGRLEERSAALPCVEAERAALARGLAARPVWLAAALPETEEAAITAAHRRVLGLAHRLLLILLPADPARAGALGQELEAQGWSVAERNAEQDPTDDTEIYVVDSAAELGLWYRLAPISFLGGSLTGGGALRNPMEPAALGSAILHGPRPGPYGALLGRLGAARAARAVASSSDLAEALGDLLSPDRAARLAQAAWTVASDGAEATEAALGRIRALTDGAG